MGIGLSFGGSKQKQEGKSTTTQNLTGQTTTDQTGQSNTQQQQNTVGTGQTNTSLWTPEQQRLAQLFGTNLTQGLQTGFQPTTYQQTALNQLGQFQAGSPQVTEALQRAMTGQGYQNIVDPAANDAKYAAIEKQTLQDILPKVIQGTANQANLAGMLRSGKGMQLQLDNVGQITNQLANTLATLKQQDEQQRRQIELDREGRQLPAAQQAQGNQLAQLQAGFQYGGAEQDMQYNNPLTQQLMQFLGLRGQATQDTTQQQQQTGTTATQTQQKTVEDMIRDLYQQTQTKGKTTGMSGGFNLGLG